LRRKVASATDIFQNGGADGGLKQKRVEIMIGHSALARLIHGFDDITPDIRLLAHGCRGRA
jgi:hypothetical protein